MMKGLLPRQKALQEIFLGPDNYSLVKIPPMIWTGFKGIGAKRAIVANCATLPHDNSEIQTIDPFTNHIPYDWNIKKA